jgi:hypothetical protein
MIKMFNYFVYQILKGFLLSNLDEGGVRTPSGPGLSVLNVSIGI